MNRIIVLDAGHPGIVSNPRKSTENQECFRWLFQIVRTATVFIPEIADYEVRRELLRTNKAAGIKRLDTLKLPPFHYLPITTDRMLKAAELWAKARQQGKPTADPHALDGT